LQSDPNFYVFLDSDDVIGSEYIDKIVDFTRSSDVGVGWGTNIEFGLPHLSAQPVHSPAVPVLTHRDFLPAGPSNNMIVNADAFRKAKGFPHLYGAPACEDTALCFSIQLLGYEAGYCADAIVHYRQRNSLLSAFRQQFNYGYGAVAVCKMFRTQGMPIQSPLVGLFKLFLSILLLPMAVVPKYRFQIVGRIGRRIGIAYGAIRLRIFTL
jgi:cellulose synthase/poly-beta-1,6-N-acetylglucosamine synthase-like glycosyltransferase